MNAHNLYLFTQYHISVEALAAIAGCLTWKKWKDNYFKWFVIYLVVVFLFELRIHLSLYYKLHEYISFLTVPVEMIFINYFFYKVLSSAKNKLILIGATAYCTTLILEQTLIHKQFYYFESISYTVGNLFILLYLILFFIEFANSEKLLNFTRHTIFWIALGMLIFYLGTFPFYGLYNELAKNMNIFLPYAWIATSLNYLMYILFIIGLTWGKAD